MSHSDFFELNLEVLRTEWSYTQDSIRSLDDITFKIRGWAITLSSAGLAFAYVNKDQALCLYLMLPVAIFWIVDGLFKSFQRKFIFRDREIRNYFDSITFKDDYEKRELSGISLAKAFAPPNSRYGWTWTGFGRHLKAMMLRNVVFSYAPIIFLQLLTYLLVIKS